MKKINYRLDEEKLPSYSIIKAATEGNVDAINIILKHYERYILKLSTRMIYDKTGRLCYEVDEELRRRLETKLITKILTFKLDSDWKKTQHSFESKNDTEQPCVNWIKKELTSGGTYCERRGNEKKAKRRFRTNSCLSSY